MFRGDPRGLACAHLHNLSSRVFCVWAVRSGCLWEEMWSLRVGLPCGSSLTLSSYECLSCLWYAPIAQLNVDYQDCSCGFRTPQHTVTAGHWKDNLLALHGTLTSWTCAYIYQAVPVSQWQVTRSKAKVGWACQETTCKVFNEMWGR